MIFGVAYFWCIYIFNISEFPLITFQGIINIKGYKNHYHFVLNLAKVTLKHMKIIQMFRQLTYILLISFSDAGEY